MKEDKILKFFPELYLIQLSVPLMLRLDMEGDNPIWIEVTCLQHWHLCMAPSQKKIFPTERRHSSRHRTWLSSDHSEDIRGPSISKGCNADSAFCKECCHKRFLINQSQTLLLPASVIHFHLYLQATQYTRWKNMMIIMVQCVIGLKQKIKKHGWKIKTCKGYVPTCSN